MVGQRDLDPHVKALAWIHIIGNALLLLTAICVLVGALAMGVFTQDIAGFGVMGILGSICAGFILVTGLPGILAGYALLTRRSWGRLLALVVGALGLPNFPIGTAIGIYTFWVLLPEDAVDYFNKSF